MARAHSFSVSVDQELKEEIERLATEGERSVAGEIRYLLKRVVEELENV